MSLTLAMILGIVQGVTELFPLSSLGILVILPYVLPLPFNVSAAHYLPFVTALHLGTALSLFLYFRADWIRLINGWADWLRGRPNAEGRLFWNLIWATIPAGFVGFALRHQLAHLFDKPLIAAGLLIVNAGVLWLADYWRRRGATHRPAAGLDAGEAVTVGLFQVFALLPGLSRSGLTIAGGLFEGLGLADAARFAFLLATPIIGAAALVEVPHLLHRHEAGALLMPSVVAGVTAGIVAWLSTRFLLRYFEHGTLRGLAWASLVLGLASMVLLHTLY
jgi:undecaprenyl-diphosphatase